MAKKAPKSDKKEISEDENRSYSWPVSFQNSQTDPNLRVSCVMQDQIYVIPKLFSKKLCNDIVSWLSPFANEPSSKKANKTDPQFITTTAPAKKGYASRVNDRAVLMDRLAARTLWRILKPVITGETLGPYEEDEMDLDQFKDCEGLNHNLRVYRYRAGHYFGCHYDDSVKVDVEIDPDGPGLKNMTMDAVAARGGRGQEQQVQQLVRHQNSQLTVPGLTKWTLLVYLTGSNEGDVEGGETVFYSTDSPGQQDSPISIAPQKGMALLHKHGDDCLLHEGKLVKSGAKWVLRSDLVWKS